MRPTSRLWLAIGTTLALVIAPAAAGPASASLLIAPAQESDSGDLPIEPVPADTGGSTDSGDLPIEPVPTGEAGTGAAPGGTVEDLPIEDVPSPGSAESLDLEIPDLEDLGIPTTELPQDNGDWDLPIELIDESEGDFDGTDIADADDTQEIWDEWSEQIDEWNSDWDEQMPDPVLPDENTGIQPQLGDDPKAPPSVSYEDDLTLTRVGCDGGTATYEVRMDGKVIRSGVMQEGSPGKYSAIVKRTYPEFGSAETVINIECPKPQPPQRTGFDLYIDPSGIVVDQDGNLIKGAKVVLYRADSKAGPYAVVPDGSAIMSPANRKNPWKTGADGAFQWDVVPGWYVVRAYADHCTNMKDSKTDFAQTDELKVPPPRLGLVVKMRCDSKADVVKVLRTAKPVRVSGKGTVGVTLKAKPPTVRNGSPTLTVTWRRMSPKGGMTVIPGAKGATYKLTAQDRGFSVLAVYTAKKKPGFAPYEAKSRAVRVK